MTSGVRIDLHPDVTPAQAAVLQTYLRGADRLSRADWQIMRLAVAHLAQSQVEFQEQRYTFAHFYRTFLESGRAATFLAALYQLADLTHEGAALQAQEARAILTWLAAQGFYGPHAGEASFLVVYCLYQWASFAGGYIFQITLFRDLEQSGVRFTPNDPRTAQGRFADHDLVWQGLRGDVKQSLYFLDALPQRSLTADFYLTQLYDPSIRRQRLIVLLHERMWQAINGQTSPGQLVDVLRWFPGPVSVRLQQESWIVMAYESWKSYLLLKQK